MSMNRNRALRAVAALVLTLAFAQVAAGASPLDLIGGWPKPIYHMSGPEGVAVDSAGNIYVADTENSRVVKFGAQSGSWVWGGPGISAGRFDHPAGIAVSPDDGFIYVADTGNHRIQKFTADGNHVGSWGREGGPDARGSGIREFDSPTSLCTDADGHVYVADTGNERVQMFTADGTYVLKWGEPGSTNGQFYEPTGIACSPITGDIYVVDHDQTNAHVQQFEIAKDTPTQAQAQFVNKFGYVDETADPLENLFKQPWGITIDAEGDLYVSDQTAFSNLVRKFTPSGELVASWGAKSLGDGSASTAYMQGPTGLAVLDSAGEPVLLVCDTRNDRLREFALDGQARGVRGSWGVAPGRFNQASGVAVDAVGNVFVTSRSAGTSALENNHRVQKFSPSGELIAYTPTSVPAAKDIANGKFDEASGVAVDQLGNVYVSEVGNHRIQKLDPDFGYITKWGELGTYTDRFDSPGGVAVGLIDGRTHVFVADTNNNRILVFASTGGWSIQNWGTPGSGDGQFNKPQGIAVSSDGIVYVADSGNHRVQYFAAVDGEYQFLGKWGSFGNDATHLRSPQGIAISPLGEVLVSDTGNDRIKRFDADGTPLGGWGSTGSDLGEFRGPRGIAVALDGTVYVADTENHRVQYLPPGFASAEIRVTRSTAVTAYGGAFTTTARLYGPDGTLLTGKTLKLYRSYDGVTWTYRKSMTSETGEYVYSTNLTRRTYFRWSYEDDAGLGSVDGLTYANSKAYLSQPSMDTSVRKGAYVKITGALKPRHASGTKVVTICAYQRVSGSWVLRSKTAMRISDHRSYSKYEGYVQLTRAGRWRLRAVHSDDSHAYTRSLYRYVTVE